MVALPGRSGSRQDDPLDEVVRDFVAEALEGLKALDSKMVRLEQAPDDPALLGEIFRLAHTLKGTSGFLGLSRLQGVAHAAENVLGAFRDGTLAITPAAVSAILDVLDVIREIVDHLSVHGEEPVGDDSRLIAALDAIFTGEGAGAPVETKTAARPLLEQLGGEATLDAACEAALFALALDVEVQAVAGALDADRVQSALRDDLCKIARGGAGDFPTALGATLPGLTVEAAGRAVAAIRKALMELEAEAEAVDRVLAPPAPSLTVPPKPEAIAQTTAANPSADSQSIRVNVEVLENLMTVVSELVLIRNQLIQTLRLDPESPFAGPLNRLNQVTSELQEGVMTTRMQPISGAWAKLPRLVRDLAADLGKSIELVMQGQETELDRQVLELIKDPLTHMIRNAADHGIETPERRRAAGKPGTGRILLQARHEGGAILVEMSDDGRGLPAEAIRAKALSAGLITPAQASAMTDAEARQLIFAAGFSTADQVTAVSGRGVGMDVVRTNIEKIGGAIELASVEGQGTRFTIRIPLTLSIVSALIVEASGERFAMPQSSIIELVSTGAGPLSDETETADGGAAQPSRRIEAINGAWVLRLRDRLLPLVSLQALLGLEEREDPRADACIVVARIGAFTFGVIVDRVFDTEEIVVKPVASVLRHLKIYSGATIMGDGSVIMILDFKGMSLEAGAGHLVNGAEDALEAGVEASGETRTLLVFKTPEDALKAAPLDSVARIEDLDCATIEHVDGRSVIQYRGALMPVVGCDGTGPDRRWGPGWAPPAPAGLRPGRHRLRGPCERDRGHRRGSGLGPAGRCWRGRGGQSDRRGSGDGADRPRLLRTRRGCDDRSALPCSEDRRPPHPGRRSEPLHPPAARPPAGPGGI
jgi:two-component system chemotaxis sensor kinase CheA